MSKSTKGILFHIYKSTSIIDRNSPLHVGCPEGVRKEYQMFVKTGDTVKVIAGKDRGTTGKVIKALPKMNKVIVEGVAIMKKHQKPDAVNPNGAILEIEAPIHVSNVQVLDKNGVAGRVGYKEVDGKKVRFNKKSGEILD